MAWAVLAQVARLAPGNRGVVVRQVALPAGRAKRPARRHVAGTVAIAAWRCGARAAAYQFFDGVNVR